MKIVTWNCGGALRKKLAALDAIDADVYVVQECENPASSTDRVYKTWASNHLWIGGDKSRGLGVFARPGITLESVSLDPGTLEYFLPYRVDGIAMLAVWTKQANSPTFAYIGQLWKWLQRHGSFLSAPHSMLLGDLNSNSRWDIWDRWWNHSDVVKDLEGLGLVSLYHRSRSEAQGAEITPTFFLYRKVDRPYHIDYAFLSEPLLDQAHLEVGRPEDWLALSDHMPVTIKLSGR